ncbi:ParM/StbA family protein (plasmid) [Stutzerimonas frequens]|uniref:ParM/StbA family protein n=1 Tax=Stutzerimonas frequens TaxID=2968969 RepID=UPI002DB8DEA6|nr:ParM/StbA family protein [Stutzerimonas frequens]WRW29290.1 ParM/StbA family protein [Stutzerimonas frequens]
MNTKPAKKMAVIPRLVANDNGYAAHKVAWLDQKGKIMTGKIPTQVQAGGNGLSTLTGGRVGAYKVGEDEYHCSSLLTNPLSLRNEDYPVSVANRVLFNHALAKFSLLGMPVRAAVTLPFRDYFNDDGSINEDLKNKTQQNFETANVEVIGSEAQPDVVGVRVCAEALSAWFDWAMNDDGSMTEQYNELHEKDGTMLVVDIGGSTTDIASLGLESGELLINQQRSGTVKTGVLDALAMLERLVLAKMEGEGVKGMSGHSSKLSQKQLELILEKGAFTYSGRPWTLAAERDIACKAVAESIVNFIKTKVGNPGEYFAILVVGGGAIVFRKWIEAMFQNAVFGDEFSNAKGALKYMRGAE